LLNNNFKIIKNIFKKGTNYITKYKLLMSTISIKVLTHHLDCLILPSGFGEILGDYSKAYADSKTL